MAYIVTAKAKNPNIPLCFVNATGLDELYWCSDVKTAIPRLFKTFEQARGVLNKAVMIGMKQGWSKSYDLAVSDPKILEE